jgi:hypothetical protein
MDGKVIQASASHANIRYVHTEHTDVGSDVTRRH